MTLPPIDLPKLTGLAGSSVGLIIASAILQSWITAKYVPASERYRALTGELRGGVGDARREALSDQIRSHRRRLHLLSQASLLLNWLLIASALTMGCAGISLLLPELHGVEYIGVVGLFSALLLIVAAVALVGRETREDRRALDREVDDLGEEVQSGPSVTSGGR